VKPYLPIVDFTPVAANRQMTPSRSILASKRTTNTAQPAKLSSASSSARRVSTSRSSVGSSTSRRLPLRVDVLDVRLAALQRLHLAPVDVDADHVVALLGEGHRERESDIARAP
jgi:hypothetical protein